MVKIHARGGSPLAWLVAAYLSAALSGCADLSQDKRDAGPPSGLVPVRAPRDAGQATAVLVGGINDTYHFLDQWGERYRDAGLVVYGFECDYGSKTMTEAAELLSEGLTTLAEAGTDQLVITAHSMGGLVAKHALDRMAESGTIHRFRSIELNALGSPWGGFRLANLVRYAPFPVTVGRLIGYPMGVEIGSGSDFMRRLAMPLPSNAKLNVYHGTADSVATPRQREEIERFHALVRIAHRHIILHGVNHAGFRDPDAIAPNALVGPARFPENASTTFSRGRAGNASDVRNMIE